MFYLGELDNVRRLSIKQDSGRLTGTLREFIIEGSVEGDVIHFTAKSASGRVFGDFSGKVGEAGIKGEGTGSRKDWRFEWTATRMQSAANEKRHYRFDPVTFSRSFSGDIARRFE